MTDAHPLKLAFAREYPGELAACAATQGSDAVARALEGLPPASAAAVVAGLPHGHAVRVLGGQDDARVGEWLNAASVDHALSLLLHVDEGRRTAILDHLSNRRMRRTLERLVVYPSETVGALVNPSAMRLNASLPLSEAIVILQADESGPEQSIWLVDDDGLYLGLLDLSSVLVARSDTLKLHEFLVPVRALRAETALAAARDFDEWQAHPELPVVDDLDHLLGSISRGRLMAALAGTRMTNRGLVDDVGELVRQYFRVMGICLGNLFGTRGSKQ